METIKRVINHIISGMYILITGGLFLYSLKCHCYVDIHTAYMDRTLVENNIILYFVLFMVITVLLIIFWNREKGKELKENRIICIIGGIIAVLSFAWILFNDCVPKYDQATIFNEARKICGYLDEPYDHLYMIAYKRQRLTTLVIAFAIKIFVCAVR